MVPAEYDSEWFAARCTEDGDCLLWKLKTSRSGAPVMYYRDENGARCNCHARSVAWRAAGKRKLKPGEVLTMDCDNPACLNPGHMVVVTRADILRRVSNEAATKKLRYATITRVIRAKQGKLTMEDARYVRASDKTLAALAQELGVSAQLLSLIRRGVRWPELTGQVFSGLGAR